MFTGIITDVGMITTAERRGDTRIVISSTYDMAGVDLGASIACSGACLTVVDKAPGWFAVDISDESIACTAQGMWAAGRRVNLERALKIGDELGGHIVTGHVDGVGRVVSISETGGSHQIVIAVDKALSPYIAPKGSVTVDGVSLTVNAVTDQPDKSAHFSLNIIPHTWAVTAFATLVVGQSVNIEIDVLARYLARMNSVLNV